MYAPTSQPMTEAQPYLVDGGEYQRAFGGTPTPHGEATRQTLGWYRGRVPTLAHATSVLD